MNKKGNKNLGKTYSIAPRLTRKDLFFAKRYESRSKLLKLIEEAKKLEIDETIICGLEVALKLMSIPDKVIDGNKFFVQREIFQKIENDIQKELSYLR